MPKRNNKEKALIALLESNSIREAARVSRLSEETIFRYLREADFVLHYREARRRAVEIAIGKLQNATGEAAETLIRNLHCENPAVEVRTAQIILDNAVNGVELTLILEKHEEIMRQTENYHYECLLEGFNEWASSQHPPMTIHQKAEAIRLFVRRSGLDEKELGRRAGIDMETLEGKAN